MNHKIKTAITSFGMSGLVFHGPILKVSEDFEIVKILERTKNNSKKMFPGATIARSYDDILNDKSIELVIVNTPDHLHFEMTKQALLVGKHVLVEKAFTGTYKEAKELVEISNEKGLLLTVYQNRRLDGDFLTVKKVVEEGKLGRLVEFESHYDRFRNVIPQSTWKEEDDNHAGSLYNLGSHMIDQAIVLFGKPESVTAHLDNLRTGSKILDYYDVRLQYKGFAALLKCSLLVKKNGPRYIIHGDNGTFIKYGIDPQEEELKLGALPYSENWGEEPKRNWGELTFQEGGEDVTEIVPTIPGDYRKFYKNLAGAIHKKNEPLVKPDEMLLLMQILETCLESNKLKKTIFL